MSVMDIINSTSPTLPPNQPEMMTLDLPSSYKVEPSCAPCDLVAAKEFEYLTGMKIQSHLAKDALQMYSENRLLLPKQAQNRAISFEEHGQATKIHRMYLNKFSRELKKNPTAARQMAEALKRKHVVADHKFKNRMTECMNKINQVHPFNAKAKWDKIDPEVGIPILRQMEGLIQQGKTGAAYQKLQQLYHIQPADRVQEIDKRGFSMRSIVQLNTKRS